MTGRIDSGRPDQVLVELAKGGGDAGRKAFQKLVRRYQARVVRLTTHLLGGHGYAEDVAQDAFVRAYLAIERHPSDAPVWPWLRVIATRLAFNHRRDASTRRGYEGKMERGCGAVSPLPARQALERVLDQLPYPYREVLVLRYVEELSVQDIADELDLGLSAAKMRLSRAREEFREHYARVGGRATEREE